MVRDRIPGGRDFPLVQTAPGAHPASCKMGAGSFPGIKLGRGVLLTTHPLLVQRSWKSRASYTSTHPLGHTGPVTGSLYLYLFLSVYVCVYVFVCVYGCMYVLCMYVEHSTVATRLLNWEGYGVLQSGPVLRYSRCKGYISHENQS